MPQGTWLLIRYDNADAGARPVASGDPFWESPDIWIEGGDALGNAIAGKPTPVFARIWNFGSLIAAPTLVEFAFVDPSLGIPWDAPRAIGSAYVIVPGLATVVVRSPVDWIPPDTGSTHSCLFVRCSCPIFNDQPSPAGSWSPFSDRHVAQHNVGVVAAQPGDTLSFFVHATNVSAMPATVQLAAQASWVTARSTAHALLFSPSGVKNVLASLNKPSRMPNPQRLLGTRAARLFEAARHVAGEALSGEDVREAVRLDRVRTVGHGRIGAVVMPDTDAVRGLNGFSALEHAVRLEPLEHRHVSIDINVPDREDDDASHFVVRVAQLEDDFVTGGYTFVIDVSG